MKIIKVTTLSDKEPLYLNSECISAFYADPHGTKVFQRGNGEDYWLVSETPEQIVDYIFEAENL